MEPDFTGWATKVNVKCSDGRTIMPDAFKHMDDVQVPLVWQHGHSDHTNVLGYAVLKALPEGVRAEGYFNSTAAGKNVKLQVEHKDLNSLSIYANGLIEKGNKNVFHGNIREVSLVLSGANPEAKIDFVNIRHSDGSVEELDDEAIITFGLKFEHSDGMPVEQVKPVESTEPTIQDVYDSMTDEQKAVVGFIADEAVRTAQDPDGDGDNDAAKGVTDDKKDGEPAAHSDDKNDKSGEDGLAHKEGAGRMPRNVFDQTNRNDDPKKHELSHDDMKGIFTSAEKNGSLKEAVDEYALKHGIEPIDILFPNFQNLTNTPQFLSKRMEWVQGVLDATSKTPFSRVRTIVADITMDEARARGYIKGTLKKEEWFSVSRRTTDPTTVYKKQKLDRDDIIDITDFDTVAWMKGEMMLMLKAEIAQAILISDGRAIDDPDKIKDPMAATSGTGLRSIINEHELFKTDVYVNVGDASSTMLEVAESILRSMRYYKGTGRPTFYTTLPVLTSLLLVKDGIGRRYWNSPEELAAYLMVDKIVAVEAMETMPTLFGILVNLGDYNVGADKGGEVSLFDFFDIDYNQYKYLSETRISGALTKPKCALVVWSTPSTNVLVTPTAPTFVKSTGVATVPTQTGVVYKNNVTGATLTAGAQTALTADQTLVIEAHPASGYFFETDGLSVQWTFHMPAA